MEADEEHEVMEISLENDDFSDNSEGVEVRQNHRDEECTMRVTDHTHEDRMNKENSIKDSTCDDLSQDLEVKSETRKKVKTKTKEYPCDHCSLVSHSSANYKKHLMTHTGERPYKCLTCHKTFRQKNHLINHQHIHSGKRHFECEECGTQFIQKSSLNLHRKRHRGIKPFTCSECNYAAYEKVHLDVHMRKHTGEKPYQCDQCGQTFSSANRLKFHCMIHTGERRYKCEKCGVPFREKATLEAHMAVHLDIGPFECDECGQQFPRLASLSLHRKVHENKDNFLYVHNKEALQYFNSALKNTSKKAVVMKEPSQESEKVQDFESGQGACLNEEDMTTSDKPGDEEESVLMQSRREGTLVTSPQPPHNTVPVPTSSPHDNCSPIRNVLSSSKIDSQDKLKENLASNLGVEQSCSDVNFDQVRKALEKGTVLETHGDDGKGFFIVLPPSLKNKELMMLSDSIRSTSPDKPNPNMNLEESDAPFGRSNSLNMLPDSSLGSHRGLYLRDEDEVEESNINSIAMQEGICSDVEGEMIHPCEAESVECIYNRRHHEEPLETMEAFEEHVHSDGTSLHLWKSNTDKLTNVTYIIESGDMEPFIIQTEEEGQTSELNDGDTLERNMSHGSRRNYYIVEEMEGSDGRRSRRCVPVKIKIKSRKSRVRKERLKREYKCMHCGKDCKNSSNYIAHSRTHSGERPYYCGFCREGFKQISHLRSHIRVHTGERPYVCGICLASFTQSSRLNSHKRKVHLNGQTEVRNKKEKYVPENRIKNFYCRYCNKTFINECLKVDHMKMHRPLFPYSCKICGMQFKCRRSMQNHYLRHSDSKHVCELCGVKVATLEELHKHRLEEHGKHPSSDSYINVKIGEDNAFNVFNEMLGVVVKKESYNEGETTVCEVKQEVIHVTDDDGNIRSEVEGISVCEESQVAVHDITHVSPVKEKQKREQGKGFGLSKASNKRVLSSLEDDCDVVRKEKNKRQIKTYINDDGKKVWECKVCDRSFGQSSNLYCHMRLHTGDKPYQCSVCSSAFRQITHLKDHMRRHTGARPHKCSKCGKHFTQRSALKRHIRALHGGDGVALREAENNVKIEVFDSPSDCDDVRVRDILEAKDDERLHTHTIKENVFGVCEEDMRRSGKSLNIGKVGSVYKESCECGKKFYTIAQLLKHQEMCSVMEDEGDNIDSEMVSVREDEKNTNTETEVQKSIEKQERSFRNPDSKNENNTGRTDNKKQKHKTSTKGDNLVKQSQFKCKECDEVLQGITSYITHLQGHGGELHQVCSMCGEVFKRASTLRYHQSLKHGKEDRRYKDYYPGGNITAQEEFEEEMVRVKLEVDDDEIFSQSDEDFEEETTRMKPSSKHELRPDIKGTKGDALKIRNNTRKKAESDRELNETSPDTTDINIETINHVCRTCGMKFTQSLKLRLHKSKCKEYKPNTRRSTDGRKEVTNQGGNRKSKRSVNASVGTISVTINEDPVTNSDGNTGETSSELKKGSIAGNEEVEFRCKFCDKLFLNTSSYEKHLPSHNADKPFECDKCCMTFRRKAHLFNHYRRHARESIL